MSLVEQERALFSLLFDPALRARFADSKAAALAGFALSASEQADFESIRLDALELDARMRVDLILQRMCRAMPVTFSLASSLPGGLDEARSAIDLTYLDSPPSGRASMLGRRMREFLVKSTFQAQLEQSAAVAICDAELSMTLTAQGLRDTLLSGQAGPDEPARKDGWETAPLRLAPYVSVALLSQSYTTLKRALCPVAEDELWPRLSTAPLPSTRRTQTLAHESPRLLVARAHAGHRSACEVTIDHRMLELSAGFAPLLSHLDGKISVATLLTELKKAGAADKVCEGVRSGFVQLLDQGMLLAG